MPTIYVIMKTMSVIAMQTYQFQFAIQTYSDKTDSVLSEQTKSIELRTIVRWISCWLESPKGWAMLT